MRVLRLVAPAQLRLMVGEEMGGSWWDLPETTRVEVLGLLSRLIARGVLDEEGDDG